MNATNLALSLDMQHAHLLSSIIATGWTGPFQFTSKDRIPVLTIGTLTLFIIKVIIKIEYIKSMRANMHIILLSSKSYSICSNEFQVTFYQRNFKVSSDTVGMQLWRFFMQAKTMAKLSRAFHEKSSEISLCSIILNLAEDTNVIFEQKATYPANMFISDIGGSAGLILGMIRTFTFFEFEF